MTTLLSSSNLSIDIPKLKKELEALSLVVRLITPGPSYLSSITIVNFVTDLTTEQAASAQAVIDNHISYRIPGTTTFTGDVAVANDLTVTNDFDVKGTQTSIESEELSVKDNIVSVNSSVTEPLITDVSGIEINRGGGTNQSAQFIYDERTGQTPAWKLRTGTTGPTPAEYKTVLTTDLVSSIEITRSQIAASAVNGILFNDPTTGKISDNSDLIWDNSTKTLEISNASDLTATSNVLFKTEGAYVGLTDLSDSGAECGLEFHTYPGEIIAYLAELTVGNVTGKGQITLKTSSSNAIVINDVNGLSISGQTSFSNDVYLNSIKPLTTSIAIGNSSCTSITNVIGTATRLNLSSTNSILSSPNTTNNIDVNDTNILAKFNSNNRLLINSTNVTLSDSAGSIFLTATSDTSGGGAGVYLGGGMLHFSSTTSVQTTDNSEIMNLSTTELKLTRDSIALYNKTSGLLRHVVNNFVSGIYGPDHSKSLEIDNATGSVFTGNVLMKNSLNVHNDVFAGDGFTTSTGVLTIGGWVIGVDTTNNNALTFYYGGVKKAWIGSVNGIIHKSDDAAAQYV